MISKPKVSIIIPCHNEEQAVQKCLDEIREVISIHNLDTEIVVVDNGSTDRSLEILKTNLGAFPQLNVICEPHLGYGSAYQKGFETAQGQYLFMADCDGTYSFKDIPRFLAELEKGYDLVVGNRFNSALLKGVMPWHHRYIGNPILSFITKLFFGIKIGDIHCGARAISRDALNKIVLYTTGMEFASEMIIKCARQGLKITEIPISYSKRIGISKLESFSDGWRHLRFILLYSPLVLFFIPGTILFLLGSVSLIIMYVASPNIFGLKLYVHPMFFSSILTIIGYQLIFFAGFARTYAITHLGDTDRFLEPLYKHITIEKAGFVGIILCLLGGFIYVYISVKWIGSGFGSLDEIRNSVLALTLVTLGVQTFFSAFMLSMLGIKER